MKNSIKRVQKELAHSAERENFRQHGKKFLLLVAVAMMTVLGAQAQVYDYETKHEVAVSYGIDSNSQIIDVFEEIGGAMFGAKLENEKFFGPISAEYFYHIEPWLGVGGILAYGVNKQDAMSGKDKIGESKNSYLTLMPALKFDWLRKQYFGMYSKIAVGATLRNEKYDSDNDSHDYDNSTVHFNWQLSFVGIEAGSPTIRAFAELGFGEQGIIQAGVRCKF